MMQVFQHAVYVAEKNPPAAAPIELLASRWIPGLGVALRAHAGDEGETFLSYRQGYFISHCDDNQGDFVLFSKGAPLVDISLFAYPLHQHKPYIEMNAGFGWYSSPRLSPQDVAPDVRQGANNSNLIGAWNPSSDVHAHSFEESVDYLRGAADYPPLRWTRQILFLKGMSPAGPNYFVFRDSFIVIPGAVGELKPYWWNMKTVGPVEQVSGVKGGLDYTSPYGPRLLVRFPDLKSVKVETRQASREGNSGGKKTSETLSVSAIGPIDAGQDTVAVLYPASGDEKSPAITAIEDGVLQIKTSEGTDWVFIGNRDIKFENKEVAFRGRAGAVRTQSGKVRLVISEAPGEIRYQKFTLKSAVPASREISLAETKAGGEVVIPFPVHDIAFKPPVGDSSEVQPGVRRIEFEGGFALVFDSDEPLNFSEKGAWFRGRRGGIVVNTVENTVRLAVIEGEGAGAGPAAVWNGIGPYDLTFRIDSVMGRHAGGGRSVNITLPEGVDRYATLVVDGIPTLPGSSRTTDPAIAGRGGYDPNYPEVSVLVIPLLDGEHGFEVRNLEQPPIFRNWQAW